METLYSFSDASIRGDWCVNPLGEEVRGPEGMAMGAWATWAGHDIERCPVVAGTALFGSREGPNRAEYRALIHGLRDCLEFVQNAEESSRPVTVVICTDNRWVAGTLTNRYEAVALREMRTVAREIQGQFEYMGVNVLYERVSREAPGLRQVDELAKRAFNQLLKPGWRPQGRGATMRGNSGPRLAQAKNSSTTTFQPGTASSRSMVPSV